MIKILLKSNIRKCDIRTKIIYMIQCVQFQYLINRSYLACKSTSLKRIRNKNKKFQREGSNQTSELTQVSKRKRNYKSDVFIDLLIRYLQIWLELPKMSYPPKKLCVRSEQKRETNFRQIAASLAYSESDLLKGKRVVQSY